MACGICGSSTHNSATCAHGGWRVKFPPSIPKSKQCECCGQYGYEIQRHHTRGRADVTDHLDVCADCHLECCHGGNLKSGLAIKPRICRVIGRASYWCS